MSKKSNTLSAGRPSTRGHHQATLSNLSVGGEMKRVNFEIQAEQHTQLKIYAAKQGKTIKDLLTEYVTSLTN